MTTIVLKVENDQKANQLLSFLRDLDYVSVKTELNVNIEKINDNNNIEQAENGINFGFLKGIVPELPDSFLIRSRKMNLKHGKVSIHGGHKLIFLLSKT